MIKIVSRSVEQTALLAQCLGAQIPPGTVLAVNGDLGAGKTVFAKGLARGLGIKEVVKSPTFNLMLEYEGAKPLVHIDAYRIREDRVFEAGLLESFAGGNVVLIEWPANFGKYLPEALWLELDKKYDGENEWREIAFFCEPLDYPWLDGALKEYEKLAKDE